MRTTLSRSLTLILAATLLWIPAASASGPEDAPWGLVGAPVGTDGVVMRWNAPLASTGQDVVYTVYRANGFDAPVQVGTTNDTEFVDAALANATEFLIYHVTAALDGVEGPPSNPIVVFRGTCVAIEIDSIPPYVSVNPSDCIP